MFKKDKKVYVYTRNIPSENIVTGETKIFETKMYASSPEELIEIVDIEDHEFLIQDVKKNNSIFINTKIKIILSIMLLGIVSLFLADMIGKFINLKQETIQDLMFRVLKLIPMGIELVVAYNIIKGIIESILRLTSNKIIVRAENEFVKEKYPNEAIGSYKLLVKRKKTLEKES